MTPPGDLLLLELAGARAERHREGGTFALGPVDLSVRRGGRVAIIGPNGAGKSTLLALALGHLPATAGRVRLRGDDPGTLGRGEVARRAVLLRQHVAPAFTLSVLDYVLHGRWPWQSGLGLATPDDLRVAREALETMGCLELEARDVAQLSGGELQRVRLAKALTQQADLLVLDEPTAGLDLRGTRDLARLLHGPSLSQLGVILVTHDLGLAGAVGESAVLLAQGQVLAAGPAATVLEPALLEEAFGVAFDVHPRAGAPAALLPRP